jgi:hypothetical protein
VGEEQGPEEARVVLLELQEAVAPGEQRVGAGVPGEQLDLEEPLGDEQAEAEDQRERGQHLADEGQVGEAVAIDEGHGVPRRSAA